MGLILGFNQAPSQLCGIHQSPGRHSQQQCVHPEGAHQSLLHTPEVTWASTQLTWEQRPEQGVAWSKPAASPSMRLDFVLLTACPETIRPASEHSQCSNLGPYLLLAEVGGLSNEKSLPIITCHAWHFLCFRGKQNFTHTHVHAHTWPPPPGKLQKFSRIQPPRASWVRAFVDVAQRDTTREIWALEKELSGRNSSCVVPGNEPMPTSRPSPAAMRAAGGAHGGAAAWSSEAYLGQVVGSAYQNVLGPWGFHRFTIGEGQ